MLSSHGKLVAILVDCTALANGLRLQMQPRKNTRAVRGKPGVPGKLEREGAAPTKLRTLGQGWKERIFQL